MGGARLLRLLAAPALAGLWGAALGIVHLNGELSILDRIESTMTDLRTYARGTIKPPDLVAIVAIDDDLVREEESYPLPRATLARIVEGVADLNPRAIAVDMLLLEPGPEEGDKALAEALGRRPSALAAAAIFPAGGKAQASAEGTLARVPVAERLLLPLPIFLQKAGVGIVNVATDQTGAPRSLPLLFRTADGIAASLPLSIVAIGTGTEPAIEPGRVTVGGRTIRTDIGQNLPLSFYGPRGTIPTVSAGDILKGQVPRKRIKNRIVVLGATVTGGGDVFPTPFDPVLPGVEVIATAVSHLISGDGLVRNRTVRLSDTAIAVILPVALVGLLTWRRSVIGLAAIAGVLFIWIGFNFYAFIHGIWMSIALPLAAAVPAAIIFGAGRLWLDRSRAHHFARQAELLQRVQAPGMAQWLARNPEFLKEPVRQDAAVVFIDLSGFTGISELLGAAGTRELLDAFYGIVDEEVVAHGGAITSFTGDGAMILFGLPEPGEHDTAAAARCASGLARRTRAWLDSLPASITSRVGFKIGAHFGVVVVSRLGHGRIQQIAATGDTVNVASRLMEVAAGFGAEIAVSDDFLKAAGAAALEPSTLAGPFQARLRGRARSITVWTATNVPAEQAGSPSDEP